MEWLKDDFLSDLNRLKLSLIEQGESFLDLFMINPDLAPARLLQDKLVESCLKSGNHRYAVSRGVRRLREAFALKYRRKFEVALNPENQICVTMGTKDALPNALACLKSMGYGQRVLLGAPTYPAHQAAAQLSGMDPSFFQLSHDHEAMLRSFEEGLENSGARIVLLNFPNNPSGVCVDRNFLSRVLAIAREKDAFVLNDFVYGEMCFDGKCAPSLLSASSSCDGVAETYSLSKAYSVPGWRVAALLGESRLVGALARLKSQLDYGLFLPLQFAAAAALASAEEIALHTSAVYQRRFALLSRGLSNLGWQTDPARAGASVWARYPAELAPRGGDGSSSLALCINLLSSSKLLVMPGVLFGPQYDGYLRFALVVAEDELREVLERLESFTRRAVSDSHGVNSLGG